MREIKFRAWQKDNGFEKSQMIYNIKVLNTLTNSNRNDNLEFMQYTGLKDKNGKEIYEKDLFKDQWNEISVIKWDEEHAGFKPSKTHMTRGDMSKGEVIGNMYENPEFLL